MFDLLIRRLAKAGLSTGLSTGHSSRVLSTLVLPLRVQNSISFSTPENTFDVPPGYLALTLASSKQPILGAAHPPESPPYHRESIILGFHSLSTGLTALASLDMNSFLQAFSLVPTLLKMIEGTPREKDKLISAKPSLSLFISLTPRAYRDPHDLEKITPSCAWFVKRKLESQVESQILLGKLAVLNLPPSRSLTLDSLTGRCYVREKEIPSDHDRAGSLENLNARRLAKVVLEKCETKAAEKKAAEPKHLCSQTDSDLLKTTPVFKISEFLRQAQLGSDLESLESEGSPSAR